MYSSLKEIQNNLKIKKLSCYQLVQYYLENISRNKHLNAFLEVYKEDALKQAADIDNKLKQNKYGRLVGLVIGIKDNICYKDHKVSAASKILDGFVSLYSATAVERLIAEDAIIIGRLNCDEFAMGSSNENSAFGNVLNPFDTKSVPGGSSGGSAAAVAADMCLAALGSDTGGSIRQPASFCGVIGIKPTYGRVSRYGLIAYASSFDQIGPITKNVEDMASILEVIAGRDEYDSTASSEPVPIYSNLLEIKDKSKIKVAYVKECLDNSGLDKEIRAKLQDSIDFLKQNGYVVDPISFPYLEYMVPTYYVLTTAEASSNLSRYAGILYGFRSSEAKDIDTAFTKSRSAGFGKEVKRRIMLGTFVLSEGYYDAYYARAQKVRRILRDKTNDILKEYDLILLPTTPKTAFKIGKISDPVTMYLEDIFTVQANLTGLPAISIPIGRHSNGLPFGLQLIGKKFDETTLLSFSKYIMQEFKLTLSC